MSPTKTREEGENTKDDDSKKPIAQVKKWVLCCVTCSLLLVSPTSCGSDGYGS
jgi:hypothetical protein